MTTTTSRGRFYPLACRSAYCGRTECPSGCAELPALLEFKAWRQSTKAHQPDPVWSPTYWQPNA